MTVVSEIIGDEGLGRMRDDSGCRHFAQFPPPLTGVARALAETT